MPPGKDAIPYKVVLKPKMDEKGRITRYKGHLVLNGFIQSDAVEFDEKLAPVILLDVLLLMFGKFTSVGWHVNHADISTAFLNGDTVGKRYVQ